MQETRVCKICGEEAIAYCHMRFCRLHLNEYARALYHKRRVEMDMIKEAYMARKADELARVWRKKARKYE